MFRWRVPVRLYLVATLLLPVMIAAVYGLLALISGRGSAWAIRPPGAAALAFLMLLLLLPLEELGWRGFALPRLQRSNSALKSALIVGLLWSPWHLPLFLIPGERTGEGQLIQIALFLVFVPLFSILLTWLFNLSNGSVLIPLVLHASYNATVGSVRAPEDLETAFRVAGVLATAAACVVVVWIYGAQNLGYARSTETIAGNAST